NMRGRERIRSHAADSRRYLELRSHGGKRCCLYHNHYRSLDAYSEPNCHPVSGTLRNAAPGIPGLDERHSASNNEHLLQRQLFPVHKHCCCASDYTDCPSFDPSWYEQSSVKASRSVQCLRTSH